jgi:hypothetical protein
METVVLGSTKGSQKILPIDFPSEYRIALVLPSPILITISIIVLVVNVDSEFCECQRSNIERNVQRTMDQEMHDRVSEGFLW